MVHSDIEDLLMARLGFDIQTVGPKAVAAMVERAMQRAGFAEPQAYAWVLRHDPDAWEDFVDHVVVPETWFFRDGAPFDLVGEFVQKRILETGGQPVRILSCPCSTGEEPYSLVLSILQAGVSPESFVVDAVDVSRKALEAARAAAFNPRSFRGTFDSDHETHFEINESDGPRRLSALAKERVRFRQANIITPDFLREEATYDVVLCRNLLIYLRLDARLQAMAALRRLVAVDGILVLGHAETVFAREHGFKPVGPAGAFAFVRSNDSAGAGREREESGIPRASAPVASVPFSAKSAYIPSAPPIARVPQPSVPTVPPEPPASTESLLETATRLGDAGQLHSALPLCAEYLQHFPDSAAGYFLLGVLHDALGHSDLAVSSLRKVLYLDPNHQEALVWLALKQEARGDRESADLLRARARRVQTDDRSSKA
jgi:chemotaxis protein methyltransferase WspC